MLKNKKLVLLILGAILLVSGIITTTLLLLKDKPDDYEKPDNGDDQNKREKWVHEVWYEGFEESDLAVWKLNDAGFHQEPFFETDLITGQFLTDNVNDVIEGKQALHLISRPGYDAKTERSFTDIAKGLLTFNMKMDQVDGEMSLEVQDTAQDRLFSIHLMPDGKIAYRDNIPDTRGYGHRISTNATWTVNTYVTIMVAWYENNTYEAFVKIDDTFARFTPTGGVPFFDYGGQSIPARFKLRVNRPEGEVVWKHLNGYFDNIVVQDLSKMSVPAHTIIEGADQEAPTRIATSRVGNILPFEEQYRISLSVTCDKPTGTLYYALTNLETETLSTNDIFEGISPLILEKGSFEITSTKLDDYITVSDSKPYKLFLVIKSETGYSDIIIHDNIKAPIEVEDIEGLFNALQNYPTEHIILTQDINALNYEWTPSSVIFKGILDGQGHWIHNLTIYGATETNTFASLVSITEGATFKDLNFNNVNIYVNQEGSGLLVTQAKSGTTLIDNVHIFNMKTTLNGDFDYHGAFVGRARANVKVTNSSAKYLIITDILSSYSGGAIGGSDVGCRVDISDVYLDVEGAIKEQAFGGVIGRVRGPVVIENVVAIVNGVAPKNSAFVIGDLDKDVTEVIISNIFISGNLTSSPFSNALIGKTGSDYEITNAWAVAINEGFNISVGLTVLENSSSIDENWLTTNLPTLVALWQVVTNQITLNTRPTVIPDAPTPTVSPKDPQLQVNEVADNIILPTQVTSNVFLPLTDSKYGTTISWSSSSPDIISNTGVVTRPDYTVGDVLVTLTGNVSLKVNDELYQKEVSFSITVIALPNEASTSFSLEASDIQPGRIDTNYSINGFTIHASSLGTVEVDANSKTVDGIKHSHRIKLGGAGQVGPDGYRTISFTVTNPGILTIHAQTSSKSAERVLALSNGTDDVSTQTILGENAEKFEYVISEAGTYYLYSKSGGINIYYLSFQLD